MTNDARDAALDDRLRQWTGAGLISDDQARAIDAWERGRATPPRPSLAVEALAYVGGAVIIAAISVIAIGYWEQIGLAAQIAIPSIAAVLALVAGAAVPGRWGDLGVRMRAALWLIVPAAVFVVATVVTDELELDYRPAMVVEAAPVFVVAAVLWLVHRAAAQQVAAYASTTMMLVALGDWAIDYLGSAPGLVFAGVGIAWGAAAIGRYLPGTGRWASAAGGWADPVTVTERHRRWGIGLGAAGAVLGAIILEFSRDTAWAGIIPVALVVVIGVLRADLMVLIIGAVGTVIVLPTMTQEYLDSTVATATVLLVVGAVMVLLAIVVARRQAAKQRRAEVTPPDTAATEPGADAS